MLLTDRAVFLQLVRRRTTWRHILLDYLLQYVHFLDVVDKHHVGDQSYEARQRVAQYAESDVYIHIDVNVFVVNSLRYLACGLIGEFVRLIGVCRVRTSDWSARFRVGQ